MCELNEVLFDITLILLTLNIAPVAGIADCIWTRWVLNIGNGVVKVLTIYILTNLLFILLFLHYLLFVLFPNIFFAFLLFDLFPQFSNYLLLQDSFIYQVLYGFLCCWEIALLSILLLSSLVQQIMFQVWTDNLFRLFIQKVQIILHTIHQLIFCIICVKIKTFLISTLVLFQEVGAVFRCSEGSWNLTPFYFNSIHGLRNTKNLL